MRMTWLVTRQNQSYPNQFQSINNLDSNYKDKLLLQMLAHDIFNKVLVSNQCFCADLSVYQSFILSRSDRRARFNWPSSQSKAWNYHLQISKNLQSIPENNTWIGWLAPITTKFLFRIFKISRQFFPIKFFFLPTLCVCVCVCVTMHSTNEATDASDVCGGNTFDGKKRSKQSTISGRSFPFLPFRPSLSLSLSFAPSFYFLCCCRLLLLFDALVAEDGH